MKELDLLLQGWLQHRFDDASADERASFEALLALSDPELQRYLIGRERAPQAIGFAVEAVLRNARVMSSQRVEPSR
jgi:succinate dehydrogenase flavin-adding protein (antitoxin of CptAB toxin-antitoxin module)